MNMITADTQLQNQKSWNDQRNWSWRSFGGLYFSKQDTRLFVPKPISAMGWTLNLARPAAAALFVSVIALTIAAAVSAAMLSI